MEITLTIGYHTQTINSTLASLRSLGFWLRLLFGFWLRFWLGSAGVREQYSINWRSIGCQINGESLANQHISD